MTKTAANRPNPSLEALSVLVGSWETTATHPMFPGKTFHGRATFDWIEGGAFLIMRTETDEPGIPTGIAIFGRDDSTSEYSMLYFDERGVSRIYGVSLEGNQWKWWRDAPGFMQRFNGTISDDRKSIVAVTELCQDGKTWKPDLEVTYRRSR
jgi:hypothetical protein